MNLIGFKAAIKDGTIRKTHDNEVAIIDVIEHLTGKSYEESRKTFERLVKTNVELEAYCITHSFYGQGKPSVVMNIDGVLQIIMFLTGSKAAKFRQDAAHLICRYLSADITLADEIVQANKDNSSALKRIQARIEGIEARNRFTDTIKEHGGEGEVYSIVTDKNNVAITGMHAWQLKKARGIKNPRDGFSTSELIGTRLAESLEADQLDIRDSHGNRVIIGVVDEIAPQIGALVRRYGSKEITAESPRH